MSQFEREHDIDEFSDLFDDYSAHVTSSTEKETTVERRKKGVRYWLAWCESEGVDAREPDETDVRRYLNDILDLSAATIASRFSSLNMLYAWYSAVIDPDLDNPAAEIDISDEPFNVDTNSVRYVRELKRQGKENAKIVSKATVEEIYKDVPNPAIRNELIMRLLWQTAMRADELSRVKIDNIDRDKREIRIRSSKLDPEQHPELYHRYVFYEPSLDALLDEWLHRRRPAVSPHADDSPYLLLSHQSEQMTPGYISRIVKESAHNAGVQEAMYTDAKGDTRWLITAHRLRHSRISYLANETPMGINSIRRMAGHAKLETTQEYITTSWDRVREDFRRSVR